VQLLLGPEIGVEVAPAVAGGRSDCGDLDRDAQRVAAAIGATPAGAVDGSKREV
jgi:hypothetical protein